MAEFKTSKQQQDKQEANKGAMIIKNIKAGHDIDTRLYKNIKFFDMVQFAQNPETYMNSYINALTENVGILINEAGVMRSLVAKIVKAKKEGQEEESQEDFEIRTALIEADQNITTLPTGVKTEVIEKISFGNKKVNCSEFVVEVVKIDLEVCNCIGQLLSYPEKINYKELSDFDWVMYADGTGRYSSESGIDITKFKDIKNFRIKFNFGWREVLAGFLLKDAKNIGSNLGERPEVYKIRTNRNNEDLFKQLMTKSLDDCFEGRIQDEVSTFMITLLKKFEAYINSDLMPLYLDADNSIIEQCYNDAIDSEETADFAKKCMADIKTNSIDVLKGFIFGDSIADTIDNEYTRVNKENMDVVKEAAQNTYIKIVDIYNKSNGYLNNLGLYSRLLLGADSIGKTPVSHIIDNVAHFHQISDENHRLDNGYTYNKRVNVKVSKQYDAGADDVEYAYPLVKGVAEQRHIVANDKTLTGEYDIIREIDAATGKNSYYIDLDVERTTEQERLDQIGNKLILKVKWFDKDENGVAIEPYALHNITLKTETVDGIPTLTVYDGNNGQRIAYRRVNLVADNGAKTKKADIENIKLYMNGLNKEKNYDVLIQKHKTEKYGFNVTNVTLLVIDPTTI